jgi:antirestriction protein ArdC
MPVAAKKRSAAELGAAFLCADLDLTPEVRDDHATYIATWITLLKDEKRAIFSAAAHARGIGGRQLGRHWYLVADSFAALSKFTKRAANTNTQIRTAQEPSSSTPP